LAPSSMEGFPLSGGAVRLEGTPRVGFSAWLSLALPSSHVPPAFQTDLAIQTPHPMSEGLERHGVLGATVRAALWGSDLYI